MGAESGYSNNNITTIASARQINKQQKPPLKLYCIYKSKYTHTSDGGPDYGANATDSANTERRESSGQVKCVKQQSNANNNLKHAHVRSCRLSTSTYTLAVKK